jgi:hypothetical protein
LRLAAYGCHCNQRGQVLGPIEDGSDFNFDFLMLLLVASILAAGRHVALQ